MYPFPASAITGLATVATSGAYSDLTGTPTLTPYLAGSTSSIGGTALVLGGRVSGTATVTGAVVGAPCIASASTGAAPVAGIVISCSVTAANTVTVALTAMIAATPVSSAYNVRVLP